MLDDKEMKGRIVPQWRSPLFICSSGFTLIEMLIVVAVIGIIAAIAIPGYLGVQSRAKMSSLERASVSAEPELQGWIITAKKGDGSTEVDTNGDGTIDAGDRNNSQLALWLSNANELCSAYMSARWGLKEEYSPWNGLARLWTTSPSDPATTNGRISCTHGGSGYTITLSARDHKGEELYRKKVTSE